MFAVCTRPQAQPRRSSSCGGSEFGIYTQAGLGRPSGKVGWPLCQFPSLTAKQEGCAHNPTANSVSPGTYAATLATVPGIKNNTICLPAVVSTEGTTPSSNPGVDIHPFQQPHHPEVVADSCPGCGRVLPSLRLWRTAATEGKPGWAQIQSLTGLRINKFVQSLTGLRINKIRSKPYRPTNQQFRSKPYRPTNQQIRSKLCRPTNEQVRSKLYRPTNQRIRSKPDRPTNQQIRSKPSRPTNQQIRSKPYRPTNQHFRSKPYRPTNQQSRSKPYRPTNQQIRLKPYWPTNQ